MEKARPRLILPHSVGGDKEKLEPVDKAGLEPVDKAGLEPVEERLIVGGKVYTFQAEDLQEIVDLGEGAFSEVKKMLYRKSGTEMAVKIVVVQDSRSIRHDLAAMMQSGKCPYIVNFYGCPIREREVWICMELMDCSMDKVAKRVYKELKSTIPEGILGKLTIASIKALHYLKTELHTTHRNIKPSKILINRKGEIKLYDFWFSDHLMDGSHTLSVDIKSYMAPERIVPMRGQRGYTIQSDIWSFGITLLELALGGLPYNKWLSVFQQLEAVVNGPPPKLPDDGTFSQELQEFSVACLMKDMDQRPNYVELQGYEFFKKYDRTEVDVAAWYESVRQPGKTDAKGTTPEEDRVTSEKKGSDASKEEASGTSEEEANDHEPKQPKYDLTAEDFREFLNTCERVMRDKDTIDLIAMHGILYGLPRAGKSSLLQRLIGKKPPTNSPSTLAAEESIQVSIQEIRQRAMDSTVAIEGSGATVATGDAIWRLVQGLEEEAVLFLNGLPQISTSSPEAKPSTSTGHETMAPIPLATEPPPQEPAPDALVQPVPEAPKQPDQDVSPQAKPLPQPSKDSPPPDALEYFKECLRKRDWKELKRIMGRQWYLYLTDSGGQPEFQALIGYLVSGPSIFFVIFRFDKDLDKLYEVEFIDAKGRSIKPYLSRHTAFETVLQSFSSIASIGGISCVQEDGTVLETKPRVLLIGTHKDLVSERRIDEVDKRFQEAIRQLDPDAQSMVQWASESQMIFAVDNTQSPKAEDVQRIRNTVHRLGTDLVTRREYEIKIPCPWLIFGFMVRKPDHPDPVLLFEECVRLSQGCGISEQKELTRALGYLDRRVGSLRHVQDKEHDRINFVVRNSQFLFTLVSDLIMQTFTFENLPSKRHAIDEFTKKGIFNSSVFTAVAKTHSKVLTPEMLLTLLKQLCIVAPIQEEGDQQRYFMPCALAHVDAVKPSHQRDQPSPVKPLLLRFSCGYVPRGMFGALITQLLQQKRPTGGSLWKLVEDQIFRDQITIKLNRKTTIRLRMLPSYFSVTLQSSLKLPDDQDNLSRLCCEVRDELLHCITQVARFLRYSCSFAPIPCFFCPEVDEGKETVDSHVAIINKDEDGEYLECSQDETKTWEPQEIKSHSIWFHRDDSKGEDTRRPTSKDECPSIQEFQCLKWNNDGRQEHTKIMEEVTPKWREFGIALGFSIIELDTIEHGCLREPRTCIQRLFGEWATSKPTYSWNGLVEGLERSGHGNLATRVTRALSRRSYM